MSGSIRTTRNNNNISQSTATTTTTARTTTTILYSTSNWITGNQTTYLYSAPKGSLKPRSSTIIQYHHTHIFQDDTLVGYPIKKEIIDGDLKRQQFRTDEEDNDQFYYDDENSQDEREPGQLLRMKECIQNGINPNIYFNAFRQYSFLRDTIKLSKVPTRADRIQESLSRIYGEKEYTRTGIPSEKLVEPEKLKEFLNANLPISFATLLRNVKLEENENGNHSKDRNSNKPLSRTVEEMIKLSQVSTTIVMNPDYPPKTPVYEIPNIVECYICGCSSTKKKCVFTKISRYERFSYICSGLCYWVDEFIKKLLDDKSVSDTVDIIHELCVDQICNNTTLVTENEGARGGYFINLSPKNVSRLVVYRYMYIFKDTRMDDIRLNELKLLERIRMMEQYPVSYEHHYLQVAKSVLTKTKTGIVELPRTNVILIVPEILPNGNYRYITQSDILNKGVVKSRVPNQVRSHFPSGTRLWKLRERSAKSKKIKQPTIHRHQSNNNNNNNSSNLSHPVVSSSSTKRKKICTKQ